MKKQASLVVIAAACAALFAAPAFAQGATNGGMKDMKASSAPMKSMKSMKKHARPMRTARSRMKLTCSDYAWQSQDMKDCEAGKMKPPNWR